MRPRDIYRLIEVGADYLRLITSFSSGAESVQAECG